MEDIDKLSELEQAFFNDGCQLGKQYLNNSLTPDDFLLLIKHVYKYTSS